jgi:hypothetical protein
VAGQVPDDLVTEARAWLAAGERVDVAQAVAFAASAGRVPLLAADVELIAAELTVAGEDTDVVHDLAVLGDGESQPGPWVFAPVRVDEGPDAQQVPPVLDLTTSADWLSEVDSVDRQMIDLTEVQDGLVAIWRAWRAPGDRSRWPAPRRVFVVVATEEHPDDELPVLAAWIQELLALAGEESPQVEVCRAGLARPAYQSAVCARAALLWAAEEPEPIRMAQVFDAVDPDSGPRFDDGHPTIDDPDEVERLLDYLDSAMPLLSTSTLMQDVFEPQSEPTVPLSFRTDGRWIWTDSISYYLERYSLAPEPELLAHLRSAGAEAPPVSEVARHRVMSFLQQPEEDADVWSVPEADGAGQVVSP